MQPCDKKKKNVTRVDEFSDIILPGLPNEIALECLARVPKLLHQLLKPVSKAWRAHLSSENVYCKPSQGLPKNYLYVHLLFSIQDERFFAWNLRDRICLHLPPFPSNLTWAKFVESRGKLFSIGGLENSSNSADVWVYEPSINKWDSLSPMKFPRYEPAVASIGGKIYVLGGCMEDSSDWAEVYDPDLDLWTSLSIPSQRFRDVFCKDCAVVNGKLYGMCYGGLGFIFDPSLSSLITVTSDSYEMKPTLDINTLFSTWIKQNQKTAVVKGVLFIYFDGKIRGYDFVNNKWLALQGTGKRLRSGLSKAFLANVEDKLCVIRKNGTEIIFACLDIHKSPGVLRCNVLWCHSTISSGSAWSIDACVSRVESDYSEGSCRGQNWSDSEWTSNSSSEQAHGRIELKMTMNWRFAKHDRHEILLDDLSCVHSSLGKTYDRFSVGPVALQVLSEKFLPCGRAGNRKQFIQAQTAKEIRNNKLGYLHEAYADLQCFRAAVGRLISQQYLSSATKIKKEQSCHCVNDCCPLHRILEENKVTDMARENKSFFLLATDIQADLFSKSGRQIIVIGDAVTCCTVHSAHIMEENLSPQDPAKLIKRLNSSRTPKSHALLEHGLRAIGHHLKSL
eukprot:Gb_01223 [translate_table: standard]